MLQCGQTGLDLIQCVSLPSSVNRGLFSALISDICSFRLTLHCKMFFRIGRLLESSQVPVRCYFSQKAKLNLFCTFLHRLEKRNIVCMAKNTIKPDSTDPISSEGMAVKRLSVEGNIAVGKSTFMKLLSSFFQEWELVTEPLRKWQHVQDSAPHGGMDNLLQMMYDDPSRWSYTFQTVSCMTRFKTQIEPLSKQLLSLREPVQVFERSIYSDRYVFAKCLFELGHFNSIEWTMYQEWHSFLTREFAERVHLNGIIYLQATPEICFERLKKRARKEEKTVQLDYLQKLHEQHENWLIKKTTNVHFEHVKNIPVLILDVNEDFENNPLASQRLATKIKNFLAVL
ncbi:deoxyguanosine kinase, mitochondrial isoform X1 [Pelobates cultripes]|uniref:deoxyguanosine kinase n=2 Tax=Pelobates cultripes TaxID=61616 RepID=A0AAD1RW89_PELCU|nr:deoxyguanosine kinase, mitochondrial isoform X1 [Pelobates cultripes]